MPTLINPLAGKPAPRSLLVDVPRLITAYYTGVPDPEAPSQRVAFGTSGHRGSSFELSFNEWHVLAITQAICDHRQRQQITGPLFLGIDTHALSQPACASALEVLAANGVDVMLATNDGYTPTPAVSHAILVHNRGRDGHGLADGILVTPSHNPPDSGGFKYNPPNGGPAGTDITASIQAAANAYLKAALKGVKRASHAQALRAATTHRHDFIGAYVADLGNVIDFDVIRAAKVRMGVDPLGGAGVQYWARIAEEYRLDLTVVSDVVDPTFGFMTVDWDGQIRMDPSSRYAMQRLQDMKDRFDIAFACDTDHDRHGIVTPTAGLVPPNHYLSVAIDYLFRHRPSWSPSAAIGKTVVSTSLIDRVATRLGRQLQEVPVGFKWFSAGLLDGSLGFGGEESAGASFLRRDGTVWTTDKDGLAPALLAAEITARSGRDPAQAYAALVAQLGEPLADRVEAPATAAQKAQLASLTPARISARELAGDAITAVLDQAPGNGAAIGGIKVISHNGWFAARPSGTEDIYKIYAESYSGEAHLQRILQEAQAIVDAAIATP
ncbi:MAG TPA: phosphoglucomutase (alpha-D-glucose-1,6-bisphosphate-dependent) [Ideonella sp.]|uniref:phosphoglucomutase (alpha-D-glucose-1,6-bisphosphate-dependent) n=1 Tax=Ideonella sp. TaxID=1929293 RepID=UPI002C6D85B5|nr:phosphoglucomutase (alpha-D-glucose-1,6-bisphosphate-dependent) [Ideonella sp.]HSI50542.1 phosphoglucomutase (alpha-D-glucose-1,6-bisphosphate-dependent) [Ideonella sp.]